MSPTSTLNSYSLASLAHRCRRETERFFQGGDPDDSFCFELFRRAIAERNQPAWELIFEQYTPLVTGWISRHQAFPQAEEEPVYFVNRAFERMWRAITPEKFERMANLKALIAYLKMCVHAALIEHVERRIKPQEIPETDMESDLSRFGGGRDAAAAVRSDMMSAAIWRCVERIVNDEADAVIARCSFVYDMKPSEIAESYPDLFPDVRRVYRQKENLLARLSRDVELQGFLGSDG